MRVLRIVDGILVIAIAAGGAWAWTLEVRRSRLAAGVERLVRQTGDFVPANPGLIHARALATAGPLQFAWRLALPPTAISFRARASDRSTTSSSNGDRHVVIRAALREEGGALEVWMQARGTNWASASTTTIDDPGLVALLRGHLDQILVEQAGRDEVTATPRDQPLTLLRLRLPPALVAAAKRRTPGTSLDPVLYELSTP